MKKIVAVSVIMLIISGMLCPHISARNDDTGTDVQTRYGVIRAAIFNGNGTSSNCVLYTKNALETSPNITVSYISAADIRNGLLTLANYEMVVFPGGGATKEAQDINVSGGQKVEDFVSNGGAYMGMCAGFFLAIEGYNTATSWVELVGAVWDNAYSEDDMMPLRTNTNKNVSLRYIGGPVGVHDSSNPSLPPYYMLAEGRGMFKGHDIDGQEISIISQFGNGLVLLMSCHPEFTSGMEYIIPRGAEYIVSHSGKPINPTTTWDEVWEGKTAPVPEHTAFIILAIAFIAPFIAVKSQRKTKNSL
jgi:hypothetical protein